MCAYMHEHTCVQISSGRYDDALRVAGKYALNTDPVYMHEWQNMRTIGVDDIHTVLVCAHRQPAVHLCTCAQANIADTDYVLRQCTHTQPVQLDACIELVDYGLQRTRESIVLLIDTESTADTRQSIMSIMRQRAQLLHYKSVPPLRMGQPVL